MDGFEYGIRPEQGHRPNGLAYMQGAAFRPFGRWWRAMPLLWCDSTPTEADPMRQLTLAQRLLIWALVAGTLFFAAVGFGWFGMFQAKEALREVHEESLVALSRFEAIQTRLLNNRRLILLAFQLDPEGGLASAHERPLSHYLALIDRNTEEVRALIETQRAHIQDPQEQALFETFVARYDEWIYLVDDVLASLRTGSFRVTYMSAFVLGGEPAGEAAVEAIAALHVLGRVDSGPDCGRPARLWLARARPATG